MMRTRPVLVVLGVVLAFAASLTPPASALADVSVEVSNGDRVTGVVAAGGETATLRFGVPAGAVLTVTVEGIAAPGSPAVAIPFEILDPADADLAAGRITVKGARSSVKKLAALRSGEHRLVVRSPAGEGSPDATYRATIAWKEPASYTSTLILDPGEVDTTLPVGAGASVKLTLKNAPRSVAASRFVSLRTAAGDEIAALAGASAAVARIPSAGAHLLRIANDGGEGTVVLSAKFRARKTSKRSIDITGAEFRADGARPDLTGAVLDEAGGVLFADDPALAGAFVAVPAGALPSATAIVVGPGAPITSAPGDAGIAGLGPTVVFGPSGLTFGSPATITLPFSRAALAGGTDTLRVVERSADGTLTLVPPGTYTIDAAAGTVSFPASHFTSYRVFGPRRRVRGDIDGDGWGDLVVPTAGYAGNVRVFFGGPEFAPSRDTDAGLVVTGDELFGADAATGDLNDDGTDDLVVMAEDVPGVRAGGVFVFFGGPALRGTRTAAQADVTIADGGTEADSDLNRRIAIADVIGDAAEDLVLGRTRFDTGRGAVYVFTGGAAFAPVSVASAAVTLDGLADGDSFGYETGVGDLSGDGRADVIAVGESIDTVSVFRGGAGLAAATNSSPDGQFALTGASSISFAAADVTGDGIADLIAASPVLNENMVYVFPGGGALSATSATAPFKITGAPALGFGIGLVAGDLDGDGVAEIVAPASQIPAASRTSLAIYRGGAALAASESFASADWTIEDEVVRDDFGARVWITDVNGDGRGDLVATAPRNDALVNTAGAVYVWFGGPGFAPALSASSADVIIRGTKFSAALGAAD